MSNVAVKENIADVEANVRKEIAPLIGEPHDFLAKVYTLCFMTVSLFTGQEVELKPITAQLQLLVRLTDFLRPIKTLCVNGYPEQAGTLTASVFETAHTILYFSHESSDAIKWIQSDSIDEQMPKMMGGKTWEQIVNSNYKHFNLTNPVAEYRIYKQLCWMKHGLPQMTKLIEKDGGAEFLYGPYTSDRSINHAWFAMYHAGRLALLAISTVLSQAPKPLDSVLTERDQLTLLMEALNAKAAKKWPDPSPFK